MSNPFKIGTRRILFLSILGMPLVLPMKSRASETHSAMGLGGAWGFRGSTSDTAFVQPSAEVIGFLYQRLPKNFWLRHGARLNFAWAQPPMPQALQIQESDLKIGIETALTYDWVLLPSLTLGVGVLHRTTQLKVEAPVQVVDDPISGQSLLPYLQGQLGLGIPIEKGTLVIEPYLRYTAVLADARISWAGGFEATFALN